MASEEKPTKIFIPLVMPFFCVIKDGDNIWAGYNRLECEEVAAKRGGEVQEWEARPKSPHPKPEGLPERPDATVYRRNNQYTDTSSVTAISIVDFNRYADAVESLFAQEAEEIARMSAISKSIRCMWCGFVTPQIEDAKERWASLQTHRKDCIKTHMALMSEEGIAAVKAILAGAREAHEAQRVAESTVTELRSQLERATDLVRYMRGELREAKLISLEEWTALVADSEGGQRVERLQGYDALRKQLATARAEITAGRSQYSAYRHEAKAEYARYEAALATAEQEGIRKALSAVKGERLECHEACLDPNYNMNALGADSDLGYSNAINHAEQALSVLLSTDNPPPAVEEGGKV